MSHATDREQVSSAAAVPLSYIALPYTAPQTEDGAVHFAQLLFLPVSLEDIGPNAQF